MFAPVNNCVNMFAFINVVGGTKVNLICGKKRAENAFKTGGSFTRDYRVWLWTRLTVKT